MMSDVQHMNPDDEHASSTEYKYSTARLDHPQYHSSESVEDDRTVFINDLGIPDSEAESLLASWGYDLKEVKIIPPEAT